MKVTLIIALIFVCISPWFLVLVRNYRTDTFSFTDLVKLNENIDELNLEQTQLRDAHLGKTSRPIVNKYNNYLKSLLGRYLESFDTSFLFFHGDIDLQWSTQTAGALYLSFLPMILVGLFILIESYKNIRSKTVIWILLISPIPAAFIKPHYQTLIRIPFLLVLTYIAAVGFIWLLKKRRLITVLLLILLIFEIAQFGHDLIRHYPRRLENQGQSFQ